MTALQRNWRKAIQLRDLLRELVVRDLKMQYKSSLLGIAWSLLNPLLQLLVFTFLFRVVMPLGISNYGTFAFSGLLAWAWFQVSLMQATSAITGNRDLIRRPGFPSAILPVITVSVNLINLLAALPLLLLFIVFSHGHLSWHILELPLVMCLQFVLILSLAYGLAAANVPFRDTQHLIGFVLQLMFWMTPVFYLASRVPGKYQALYRLNPMLHLVEAYRALLIYGRAPDWTALGILTAIAVAALLASYRLFTRRSNGFVEEL